jgi:hypothetical protein
LFQRHRSDSWDTHHFFLEIPVLVRRRRWSLRTFLRARYTMAGQLFFPFLINEKRRKITFMYPIIPYCISALVNIERDIMVTESHHTCHGTPECPLSITSGVSLVGPGQMDWHDTFYLSTVLVLQDVYFFSGTILYTPSWKCRYLLVLVP